MSRYYREQFQFLRLDFVIVCEHAHFIDCKRFQSVSSRVRIGTARAKED